MQVVSAVNGIHKNSTEQGRFTVVSANAPAGRCVSICGLHELTSARVPQREEIHSNGGQRAKAVSQHPDRGGL